MRIEFDWDPAKAQSNRTKHGVRFEDAMSVFADPLALSRLDEPGAGGEERWVTVGRAVTAAFLLVVHTHVDLSADRVLIRITSARRPSRNEIRQYEDEAGP